MPEGAAARDTLMEALPQTSEVDKAEVTWAMVVLNEPRAGTGRGAAAHGHLQTVRNLDDPPQDLDPHWWPASRARAAARTSGD